MLEKVSELRLKNIVEVNGGICLKILPSINGVPDRLVILPYGILAWVEMKKVGGRVSRIQRSVHKRLRALGQEVYILYGDEDVDAFMADMRERIARRRAQTASQREVRIP